MTEEEVLRAALLHYGETSQWDKLIEEMAELTQAILKVRRLGANNGPLGKKNHWGNLHEEFADVKIVMGQIETLLSSELLGVFRQEKIAYLQDLVSKGEKDVNKY